MAITRPRRALAVVCSPPTLAAGSRTWEAFLRHARGLGAVADPEKVLPPAASAFGGVDPFEAAAAGGSGAGGRGEAEAEGGPRQRGGRAGAAAEGAEGAIS